MQFKTGRSSWVAFGLFFVVLLVVVTVLDTANDVLQPGYWGMQAGLILMRGLDGYDNWSDKVQSDDLDQFVVSPSRYNEAIGYQSSRESRDDPL